MTQQHLMRFRDLNGSKGLPFLHELFDLRPCYFQKCFKNLWEYNDCFDHVLTSNLTNHHEGEIFYNMKYRGMHQLTVLHIHRRVCESYRLSACNS